ncbi:MULTISPECIES: FecR family protein [unclassified Saccharicrinis]|uniref:FecR family protein n=1 Tax=unclassified Saccharicrinis TaxID=2646859 RepID=UPI003D34DAC0
MENFEFEYKIAQLISKEVSGELSAEETAMLQKWLEESEENQKLYETIKRGKKREVRDKYVDRIDSRKAWKQINLEIKTAGKIRRMPLWIGRVAVILIIALLAGTVYFVSRIMGDQPARLAQVEIKPGSSKAVLMLDDGKAVQLESAENDSILESDGTLITNLNGQLAYTGSSNKNLETKYNTVKVPRGGEYHITLSDGTQVWLNSDSEIKYPVQFASNKRKVWVSGEVYFDVETDKARPFIVDVKDIEVEVLGTEFNIEAYRETDRVATTLVEGSVKLRKASEEVIIKPEQQAVIHDTEKMFAVHNVDAKVYALWKEGIIYCEGERLEVVMDKLARWYDANLFYMNPSLKDKRFNIEVKRYENIDKILEILAATNKVRFEVHENNITIME